MGGLLGGGGQRVCWPPPLKLLGGGGGGLAPHGPPLPTPMMQILISMRVCIHIISAICTCHGASSHINVSNIQSTYVNRNRFTPVFVKSSRSLTCQTAGESVHSLSTRDAYN